MRLTKSLFCTGRNRFFAQTALILFLASCATNPSIKQIGSVDRAVAVSCVTDMPSKPKLHTDAEIKAMSDYDATITLIVERVKMEIYQMKLETVLDSCR